MDEFNAKISVELYEDDLNTILEELSSAIIRTKQLSEDAVHLGLKDSVNRCNNRVAKLAHLKDKLVRVLEEQYKLEAI